MRANRVPDVRAAEVKGERVPVAQFLCGEKGRRPGWLVAEVPLRGHGPALATGRAMDGAGDAAELRYVPGPRFHRSRLATIDRRVRQKLGDDFQVSYRAVTEVEKTARGKHRWLVSRLRTSTSSAELTITD